MKLELVVLGGGIKGSAIAAVAACVGSFNVTLIERRLIGAGTTSTNHGRLHSGLSEWISRPRDLSQDALKVLLHRQRDASQFLRQVLGNTHFKQPALYLFRTIEHWRQFRALADDLLMPYRDCGTDLPESLWVDRTQASHSIEVPEYAFDPAEVAGRFARLCVERGGFILRANGARRLNRDGSRFMLTLDDARSVSADIVINAMGRWSQTLEVDDGSVEPPIAWSQWRILCLRSAAVEHAPVDRIFAMSDDHPTNILPHPGWINLDYTGVHVTPKASPESPTDEWRSFVNFDEHDLQILDTARDAFPPLKSLSESVLTENLYSLAGVHARVAGAAKGSVQRISESPQLIGYLRTFGGQATTALLDALDIVERACRSRNVPMPDRFRLVSDLERNLPNAPIEPHTPMRWDQVPA